MRSLVLAVLVAATVSPAAAQPECPALPCDTGEFDCRVGLINIDEIWSPQDGPYLITGDLTIRPFATLTIRPGTEIRFATCDEQGAGLDAQRVELLALGTFEVQGTAEEPVVFRSHADPGAPGDWYGLVVSTENNADNDGASAIRGADIRHGVNGIYVDADLPTTIERNVIRHNSLAGILWRSAASPSLHQNDVYENGNNGIQLENPSGLLFGANVGRNVVRHNGGMGVFVGADITVDLDRSSIWGNGGPGVMLDEGASGEIVNALIYGNGSHGIEAIRLDNAALTIAHSTIHANGGDGLHFTGSLGANATAVRANIITRNAAGISAPVDDPPAVSRNDVWGNSTAYVNVTPDDDSIAVNPIYADDRGDDPAAWDLRITTGSPCIDLAPNVDAPEFDRFGEARGFDGNFDGAEFPDLGAAEFQLTTPPRMAPGMMGHINVDTVWLAADSPIALAGDVYVPPHVSLFVEPGVEVVLANTDEMAGGIDPTRVEILIDGRFESAGSKDSPVVFRCADAGIGCWHGLRFAGRVGGSVVTDTELHGGRFTLSVETTAVVRPLLRENLITDFAISGIHWTSPVAPDVRGNLFTGSPGTGTAISVLQTGDVLPPSPRIETNVIDGCGRGIYLRYAGVATVSGNSITRCNFGVVVDANEAVTARIEDNTIGQETHAEQYDGPAITLNGPVTADIDRNALFGHFAGVDAGILATAVMVNNLVYANYGHGVYLRGASAVRPSSILHATIAYNGGDGVRLGPTDDAGLYMLANSIVVENRGVGLRAEGAFGPLVASNDVWSNEGGDYVGVGPDGESLSENPRFVGEAPLFSDNDGVFRIAYDANASANSSRDHVANHPNPAPPGEIIEMSLHFSARDIECSNYDFLEIRDCNGAVVYREDCQSGAWTTPWWNPGACKRFTVRIDVDGSRESTYSIDWYEYRAEVPPDWDATNVNLRLEPNSGLIEAGSSSFESDEDFLGEARPFFPFGEDQNNARPDIGAFEFRQNIDPVAIAGDDVVVEPGETVTFDATRSFDPDGDIVEYLWDFGGGQTSAEAIVERLYADEGDFTATLTVTDDDGAVDAAIVDIAVRVPPPNQLPTAEAGADRNGFIGIPIIFDGRASGDPDGQIVAYAWNFGDGQIGDGPVVSHFYEALGSYTITLTVTDDRGGQASDTSEVQIVPGNINRAPRADAGGDYNGDEGAPVTFDGSASFDEDGNVVSWAWSFGDGAQGEGQIAAHTYIDAGVYQAELVVTDDDGAANTQAFVVFINARPLADAGANRTGEQGVPIVFDASDSSDQDGVIERYQWDFGDGQRAEGVQVQHAYAAVGQYTVRLTVTDDDGATATTLIAATVEASDNDPPIADAGDDRVAVVGDLIAFDGSQSSDPDGQVVTYRWDFGDGTQADGVEATHIYQAAGEFRVTLTVTDNEGSIDADQVAVTVRDRNEPPEADAGEDVEGEALVPVVFDGSASSDPDGFIVDYAWDFGDGESTQGARVSHTYAAQGAFEVTLTVTDDVGETASHIITARIAAANHPPVAEAGEEAFAEVGVPVHLDGAGSSDDDGEIVAYAWMLGDGTMREGAAIDHIYVEAGDYDVTLTVTDDDGAEAVDATVVHVLPPNVPPDADAGGDLEVAVGELAVLSAAASTDPDGEIVAYDWEFGDDTTGEGIQAEHTYDEPGLFVVLLTVTDDDGDSDRDTVRVRVRAVDGENEPPTAAAGPDQEVGVGDNVVFDGSGSSDPDGHLVAWSWDFGDGAESEGEAVTHSYAEPGVYVATLTVTDDGGASDQDTAIVTITAVNLPPTADAGPDQGGTSGAAIAFDGSGSRDPDGRIVDYAWDFGDEGTAQGQAVVHIFDGAGAYVVTLTVTDDAGTTAQDTAVVRIVDGVNQNLPPVVNAGPDRTGAPGEILDFDGSASVDPDGEIETYTWDFGDGATADGAEVSHAWEAPGVYTVSLRVTDDDGAIGADLVQVVIEETEPDNLPPTADAGDDQAVEVGRPATFDGSVSADSDGQIVAWAWDFGDGGIGAGEVTSHTYERGGIFTVTLTVTDNLGATARDTARVTVNAPPTAEIFGPDTARVGATVRFDGVNSEDVDGEIVEWTWDFGDGSVDVAVGETVDHVYAEAGLFTVRLTVTDDGGSTDRATHTIEIVNAPDAEPPSPDAEPGAPDAGPPDATPAAPDAVVMTPDTGGGTADATPQFPDAGGPAPAPADDSGGCACDVRGGGASAAWWLALLVVPMLRRRRRRLVR